MIRPISIPSIVLWSRANRAGSLRSRIGSRSGVCVALMLWAVLHKGAQNRSSNLNMRGEKQRHVLCVALEPSSDGAALGSADSVL